MRSYNRHTQWHVLSVPKASFMCKCLIENPQLLHKYRGAHGTLRITAEVVNVCDLVGGSVMALTLVTASAMMAELGPVPLGPRHAACKQ